MMHILEMIFKCPTRELWNNHQRFLDFFGNLNKTQRFNGSASNTYRWVQWLGLRGESLKPGNRTFLFW
jgi:hypothetical protein